MPKDIRSKPIPGDGDQSFKDFTVEACFCGNRTFVIVAMFDEGTIAGWFTNARCFECGAWVSVPAPVQPEESYVTS